MLDHQLITLSDCVVLALQARAQAWAQKQVQAQLQLQQAGTAADQDANDSDDEVCTVPVCPCGTVMWSCQRLPCCCCLFATHCMNDDW